MPDVHKISFTVNPRLFGDALSEVTRDMDLATGILYVAAIEGPDTDLYDEQSCLPGYTPDNPGRVVIGIQGKGRNYCFADFPAEEVHDPGVFLIGKVEQLSEWSSEAEDFTQIIYKDKGTAQTLNLSYPSGFDKIAVRQHYQHGDFQHLFQAHQDRFTAPHESINSEELASMLKLAGKIAPTDQSTKRSGDLSFEKNDKENAVECKFLSLQQIGKTVTATNQSVKLNGFPLSGFTWEVNGQQLSLLQRILKMESVTGRIVEEHDNGEVQTRLFQTAYNVAATGDNKMYVHRQNVVRRENHPIDNWTENGENIFEDEYCKLFAAVPATPFTKATRKTWALKKTDIIKTSIVDDNGHDTLKLETSGGNNADKKMVTAMPGDSEIESYYFMPSLKKTIERIVGDAEYIQIRSFPLSDKEADAGYVVVPIPEEVDDPTEFITNPQRHAVITWESS